MTENIVKNLLTQLEDSENTATVGINLAADILEFSTVKVIDGMLYTIAYIPYGYVPDTEKEQKRLIKYHSDAIKEVIEQMLSSAQCDTNSYLNRLIEQGKTLVREILTDTGEFKNVLPKSNQDDQANLDFKVLVFIDIIKRVERKRNDEGKLIDEIAIVIKSSKKII